MKLGVEIFFFKITIGRTIFNFSCKTSGFCGAGCFFGVTFLALFCHFFCLIRGERAKRASANSRHESRAREAGRHHPRPRCRLPTPLWNRGAKRRGWSSVARYEGTTPQSQLWVKKWSEVKVKVKVKVIRFGSFIFPETYIYYRSCLYLKRYTRKMCTTIVLWV